MKTIKRLILFLSFILTLTGCPPIPWADCFHNFIYQGTVQINDSISKENLVIRFDNLGDIIFNTQHTRLVDTSIISDNGSFKVEGHFFTTCASDKNIFDDNDSLAFQIASKNKIIKTGKFKIKDLNPIYQDKDYFTTITLPIIIIK